MASVRHRWPDRRRLTRLASAILCAVLLAGAAAPAAAGDDDFFTHLHTDKAMANVTVSPGRTGPVDIAIQLETVDERPLVAKAVSVTLTNPKSKSGRQTIEATRITDDRWQAKAQLPQSGRWMLGLGISISDGDKISIEAPILIGAAAPKGAAKKSGKDGAAHHHH
jgi:copper transport protein